MIQHVPQPATVAEDGVHTADKRTAGTTNETMNIPIAYEEVTLTVEAADLLEQKSAETAERAPRKVRRMASGDPADLRR